MSDTAILIFKALAGKEADIPRFEDWINGQNEPAPTETADQVISRFDKLRRR